MDKNIEFDDIKKMFGNLDITCFNLYLKDLYSDLRRKSKEKSDGITPKVLFDFLRYPVIISEKIFQTINTSKSGILSKAEFITGMHTIYLGDFEETLRLVFNIYDFTKSGVIRFNDVKLLLSYLPLKTQNTETYKTYEFQKESIEELNSIVLKFFEKETFLINWENFVEKITTKQSDIYLLLLSFLWEYRPFRNESINAYINSKQIEEKNNVNIKRRHSLFSNSSSPSNYSSGSEHIEKKRIASPSKRSKFIASDLLNNIDVEIDLNTLNLSDDNCDSNLHSDADDSDSEHKNIEVPSMKCKKSLFSVNDLDSEVKPARKLPMVKFSSKQAFIQKLKEVEKSPENTEITQNNNIVLIEEGLNSPYQIIKEHINYNKEKYDIPKFSFKNQDIQEDKIDYENHVLKMKKSGSFKKVWLVLIGQDIFYFRNNEKTKVKGIHNLGGVFLEENGLIKVKSNHVYCFGLVFPNKVRKYYIDNENIYSDWVKHLSNAIGYLDFNDFYEIKKQIGSGKYGTVYVGVDKKTKEKAAIKVIKKKKIEDEIEAIRTEIDILSVMKHPNIISLVTYFENADYLFLVMDYCNGGDLGKYFETVNKRLPEAQAKDIIYQLVQGVKYLHDFGIIHRDIKPDNILLDLDPKTKKITVKISDFGLSKIVSANESVLEGFGTLVFVAPEILHKVRYNNKVDVWSLGVLIYYLLSGVLPFDDNSNDLRVIAKKIAYEELNLNILIKLYISDEAIDLISKCLIKESKERILIDQLLSHPWFRDLNLK